MNCLKQQIQLNVKTLTQDRDNVQLLYEQVSQIKLRVQNVADLALTTFYGLSVDLLLFYQLLHQNES